jgi:uncharacterized membrane-anchored protein
MNKIITLLLISASSLLFSQKKDTLADLITKMKSMDTIEKSLKFEHGVIKLKNGVAQLTVPQGFKFLNAEQAKTVLVDLWGNPDGDDVSLGLLMPENVSVMSDSGYVFNVQYDEIGFVKDDDADKIDYNDLLKQLKEEAVEDSKERVKLGYEPIQMIGWASPPYYDKTKKILHWAKEIKFGENEENTLNYNIRVLGRKGVLVLNAISTMPNLKIVKDDLPKVMNIVQFSEGNTYKDFDPKVDEVAAWTIGGLVAGKVLAKVGIFALIAKVGKIVVLAVIAFFGTIGKRFFGKKDDPIAEEQPEDEIKKSEEENPEV